MSLLQSTAGTYNSDSDDSDNGIRISFVENNFKKLEKLKRKIQMCYIYIKHYLKACDIESILDNFIQNGVSFFLIDDIRSQKTLNDKVTKLLDFIFKADMDQVLLFLDLIQYIVPDVYYFITGKIAKKPSIPERFYSPITRQSSALRETIKKLESFQNSKEYEGWKKDVELFEHHIGNMINFYTTMQARAQNFKANFSSIQTECENCSKLKAEIEESKKKIRFLEDLVAIKDNDDKSKNLELENEIKNHLVQDENKNEEISDEIQSLLIQEQNKNDEKLHESMKVIYDDINKTKVARRRRKLKQQSGTDVSLNTSTSIESVEDTK